MCIDTSYLIMVGFLRDTDILQLRLTTRARDQLFQANPRPRVHRHARARTLVDKDVRVPSHRSRCILAPRRPVSPHGSEHPDLVRDRAPSQSRHSQTQVEDVWERQRRKKLGRTAWIGRRHVARRRTSQHDDTTSPIWFPSGSASESCPVGASRQCWIKYVLTTASKRW
jgi:hypothetical protein